MEGTKRGVWGKKAVSAAVTLLLVGALAASFLGAKSTTSSGEFWSEKSWTQTTTDDFQVTDLFKKSVGVIEGLPNGALKASNSINTLGPENLRLDAASGWCAVDQGNDFVVVNLLAPQMVTGFAIQGRGNAAQWVTELEVFTSNDGLAYVSQGLFKGSFDNTNVQMYAFGAPVRTVYVKLQPKAYSGHTCMRADIQ
eukprot:44057_1